MPTDTPTQWSHVREVLRAFAEADCRGELFWAVQGDDVKLFADCSDWFYWATSDLEEITGADLALLQRCLADLRAIDATEWLAELFAARKRGMRPQRPVYTQSPNHDRPPPIQPGTPIFDLFMACGPERDPKSEG